jgi:hypothetical protein
LSTNDFMPAAGIQACPLGRDGVISGSLGLCRSAGGLFVPAVKMVLAISVLLAALPMAGCGSNLGTSVPTWAGGEPPGLPPATAATADYPNVYDVPPKRRTKLISEAEQTKLQADLNALRNHVSAEGDAAQREKASEQRK